MSKSSSTVPSRKELIHRMRAEGLNDAIIARVFQVSRERISKIAGRVQDDPNIPSNGRSNIPIDTEQLLNDISTGDYNISELAARYKFRSSSSMGKKLRDMGLYDQYRRARQHWAEQNIRTRLADFAAHLHSLNLTTYETCDLLSFDRSLYNLAVRTGKLELFSNELGLQYSTAIRRRERHNTGRNKGITDAKMRKRREM